MKTFKGKTAVVLLEQMVNEQEFWYPKYRLEEAGLKVIVAGPEKDKEYPSKFGIKAKSDAAFADVDGRSVDVVIIPGGYAPDFMRRHKACLDIVRSAFEAGKIVAFICHAGWVPVSAGILKGKKVTSVASIKDDMINAGAQWSDAPVVVDGNLISSRKPDDLPDFMRAVFEKLAS